MAGTVVPQVSWFVGASSPYYNSDCDQTTDWSGSPTADNEVYIQKTIGTSYGSLSKKVSNTTSTHVFSLKTATDLSDTIIYVWILGGSISQFDIRANGGIRIRIEDASGNWGEWYVAGKDVGYAGGWQCLSIRTSSTDYYYTSATAPNKAAVTKVGVVFKTIISAAKINCWWDAIRYGTGLQIKGGTEASPATFDDLLTWETSEENRTGILSKLEGVIFYQGKLWIGSITSGEATYFKDTVEITPFQDKPFGTFYEIIAQGNTGALTEVYFGTKVGSGLTAKGVSGCMFRSVGASKFKFTATGLQSRGGGDDDKLGIYGCTFFDADTISLPPHYGTLEDPKREILSTNFEECAEILPDTCVMRYCNIIKSDDRGLRIASTSHNVTNSNFINCPRAVHIPNTGTYSFNGLVFSGNTYDVDNSSGGTVTINCINCTIDSNSYINSLVDEQTQNNASYNLALLIYYVRIAQRKTITNKKILKISFLIDKNGSPTGNITFRVRKVSDGDTILQGQVWGDASGITTTKTWYEVTFSNPPIINEEVRLTLEYSGGDVGNYLRSFYQNTDVKSGEYLSRWTTGPWEDQTGEDYAYKILMHDPSVTTTIQTAISLTIRKVKTGNEPTEYVACSIHKKSDMSEIMNQNANVTDDLNPGYYKATKDYTGATGFTVVIRAREKGWLPFEVEMTLPSTDLDLTAIWLPDPLYA